jgi:AAA domain
MHIAITGAHGVGKSTLAAEIAAALSLPELPTPGRTLAARGLPVNRSATVSSQLVAWLLQYRLERGSPDWVSSRSLIDVWAYTVAAARQREPGSIEQAMMDELEQATPLAIRGAYDTLVYIQPRIPLTRDEVRSADEGFQREIDKLIGEALARWAVPHRGLDVRDSGAVRALIDTLKTSHTEPTSK